MDVRADPELLEEYDNFYQTTKSLLVLFQIMGVMPIERPTKGRTTFRYEIPNPFLIFSTTALYSKQF